MTIIDAEGTAFTIEHRCSVNCEHGGPISIRWPHKDHASILPDWPDQQTCIVRNMMPVGASVSLGAIVHKLTPLPRKEPHGRESDPS